MLDERKTNERKEVRAEEDGEQRRCCHRCGGGIQDSAFPARAWVVTSPPSGRARYWDTAPASQEAEQQSRRVINSHHCSSFLKVSAPF